MEEPKYKTCLDMYYKAHPDGKDPVAQGMCPDEFEYLDEPRNCNALHGFSEFSELMSCKECWNRKIPKRIEERLAAIPEVEPDEIDKQMIEAAEKEKEMSMTKNVDTVTIDYKAEYERLNKILSQQQDHTELIRCMEHDIECKNDLIEEQRIVIDKLRTVIRCVEAFLGKDFLYV